MEQQLTARLREWQISVEAEASIGPSCKLSAQSRMEEVTSRATSSTTSAGAEAAV